MSRLNREMGSIEEKRASLQKALEEEVQSGMEHRTGESPP